MVARRQLAEREEGRQCANSTLNLISSENTFRNEARSISYP
jgi:hypothetical protein